MGKRNVLCLLLVPLLIVFDLSFAEDVRAYFMLGGDVTLRPNFKRLINNVLWKLNGDLVAEWVKDAVPLEYYGRFQNRTTLDYTTGVLVMGKLTKADEGTFTVEINSQVHPQTFLSEEILGVPVPKLWCQPASCGPELESHSLFCSGDIEKAGPVTFYWKEGDGEWKEGTDTIDITKAGSSHVKKYTCKMKNPVSEKESEPRENVFFKEGTDLGVAVGIPVTIIVVIAAIAAIAGRLWWKKKQGRVDGNDVNRANGMSLSNEASSPDPEVKPLNSS
ncbi:CD48 antigen-like [Xyrichtys novacula]|uniref:CD48 antigen-like n=1 Tax=Xyrichtys novacula TaxID=13765 RepID=A0AAV1G065_XYRNO|nr:CD48 antigen-like [Xyrichtys novacula]